MVLSLAELILLSLLVDYIFRKIKTPGLVGMLLVGILAGPYVWGLLQPDLLSVSSDLRMLALIVILLRAGFELSKDTLRKVGVRAAFLSFVPATFEAIGVTILGPRMLHLTYLESAILGMVMGSVTPAVIVPLMLQFNERKKGTEKGIPTLIMAGSSIDDVFCIVMYSVLIGFYTGQKINIALKLASIPTSIILGIIIGLVCGFALYKIFDHFNPRATKRVLVLLGVSIVLVSLETKTEHFLPFAALVSVMGMGVIVLDKNQYMAHEISSRLGKLWVFAEILLFTLVGAQVNVGNSDILKVAITGTVLLGIVLIIRSVGTYLCLIGSGFTQAEKFFVIIAYIPKATAQAAIGGAPLIAMRAAGMDTRPGEIILAMAVLSIFLTAPAGAFAISVLGNRILKQEQELPETLTPRTLTEEDIAITTHVKEVMNPDIPLARETETLETIVEIFSMGDFAICPIVNSNRQVVGIIRLDDLRPILLSQQTWKWLIAGDVCRDVAHLPHPTTSLKDAFTAMEQEQLSEIPVVEADSARIVGLLDHDRMERFLKERWLEIQK